MVEGIILTIVFIGLSAVITHILVAWAAPEVEAGNNKEPGKVNGVKMKGNPESNINSTSKTEPVKKKSNLFTWIVVIMISIPIILFGYGYFTAMSDVAKGINMFGIAFRVERMNPISIEGYGMYMRNNTDFLDRYHSLKEGI